MNEGGGLGIAERLDHLFHRPLGLTEQGLRSGESHFDELLAKTASLPGQAMTQPALGTTRRRPRQDYRFQRRVPTETATISKVAEMEPA